MSILRCLAGVDSGAIVIIMQYYHQIKPVMLCSVCLIRACHNSVFVSGLYAITNNTGIQSFLLLNVLYLSDSAIPPGLRNPTTA